MSHLRKNKGFTLIELVIVLAIAALILAAVFLAVSGAQKSRRDSQRKSDAGQLVSQMETAASNNNGSYPASGSFPASFTAKDPTSGNAYTPSTGVTTSPPAGTIAYAIDATCNGQTATTNTNNRKYAVVVGLEQGGSACYGN